MLHSMEVEFPVVGGGGMNSNNRVKPNSVELNWGCVEVELGLWRLIKVLKVLKVIKVVKELKVIEVMKLIKLIKLIKVLKVI